jgi:hypothetical protein
LKREQQQTHTLKNKTGNHFTGKKTQKRHGDMEDVQRQQQKQPATHSAIVNGIAHVWRIHTPSRQEAPPVVVYQREATIQPPSDRRSLEERLLCRGLFFFDHREDAHEEERGHITDLMVCSTMFNYRNIPLTQGASQCLARLFLCKK